MNTLYFKYVLEVERTGSISQAAQNLYMAQPNLSKSIKDLEKDLGYSIFKRTTSGVTITEKGAEFIYHAKKVMEQINEIDKLSGGSDEKNRCFKISIPRGSYIANGFTAFVAGLQIPNGIDITLNETNALQTIANVADRGYNVGIIRYPLSDEEIFKSRLKSNKLDHQTIWEFEYVLVMSKTHPLATKEVINVEDLQEYTKITHGDIEIPHDKYSEDSETEADNGTKKPYMFTREVVSLIFWQMFLLHICGFPLYRILIWRRIIWCREPVRLITIGIRMCLFTGRIINWANMISCSRIKSMNRR